MQRTFAIKVGLAASSGFFAVLTLVERDWIEVVFRIDPDGGNGTLEWLFVAILGAASTVFGLLARAEWRAKTS